MKKSIFEFGDRFGVESPFGDWMGENASNQLKNLNIQGPFIDKTNKRIVDTVEKGKTYYYFALLNIETKNVSKVRWAMSYDNNDGSPYYLFSGGSIEQNRLWIKLIVEKPKESFKLYAYTGALPDVSNYLEVHIDKNDKKQPVRNESIIYPLLILQGTRKKGRNKSNTDIHDDLKYADYSEDEKGLDKLKKQLLTVIEEPDFFGTKEKEADKIINKFRNTYFKLSDEKLFEGFKNEIEWYSRGNLETVALDMIKKVKENKGGSYTNEILTESVKKHNKTITFVNQVKEATRDELIKVKGNLNKLAKLDSDGEFPIYKRLVDQKVNTVNFDENTSGLGILIRDVWAYELRVISAKPRSISENFKGTLTLKLEFGFYDHFGLDYPDIAAFPSYHIFYCWFMLQHFRGYKPLITTIEFEDYLIVNI